MAYAADGPKTSTAGTTEVRTMEIEDIFYRLLERIITNYDSKILKSKPFTNSWCNRQKALVDTFYSIFRTAKVRFPTKESVWAKATDLHSYEASKREIAIAEYVTGLRLSRVEEPYTRRGIFENRKFRDRGR